MNKIDVSTNRVIVTVLQDSANDHLEAAWKSVEVEIGNLKDRIADLERVAEGIIATMTALGASRGVPVAIPQTSG